MKTPEKVGPKSVVGLYPDGCAGVSVGIWKNAEAGYCGAVGDAQS
jgi:hypothetical protein